MRVGVLGEQLGLDVREEDAEGQENRIDSQLLFVEEVWRMGSLHMARGSLEVTECSGSLREEQVSFLGQESYGGCRLGRVRLEETWDWLVTLAQETWEQVSCACENLRRTRLGHQEEQGSVLQCQHVAFHIRQD